MSHLTSAAGRAEAMSALAGRRDRRQAAYRLHKWGPDGKRTPSTHVDLRAESPEAKRAFLQNQMVRADAERRGAAPGDAAQTAVATPAMTRALAEEARGD